LQLKIIGHIIIPMEKRKRGRPPKAESDLHNEQFLIKLETTEKEAFKEAAALADMPVSSWARQRLRQVAGRELKRALRPIPFLLK
jgi:hypothetical protein